MHRGMSLPNQQNNQDDEGSVNVIIIDSTHHKCQSSELQKTASDSQLCYPLCSERKGDFVLVCGASCRQRSQTNLSFRASTIMSRRYLHQSRPSTFVDNSFSQNMCNYIVASLQISGQHKEPRCSHPSPNSRAMVRTVVVTSATERRENGTTTKMCAAHQKH